MRNFRMAAAAACALLLAHVCPSEAQLVGSGHVLGNGTSSSAAPTDTPLLNVLEQSGSGLSRSGNTSTLATSNGTLTNGHCVSIDGSGNFVDAGGACSIGGGGGTVSSASQYQIPYYTTSGTGSVVGGSGSITTSAGGSSPILNVSQTTSGTISNPLIGILNATATDNATTDSSGNFFGAVAGTINSTQTSGSSNGIEGRAGLIGVAQPAAGTWLKADDQYNGVGVLGIGQASINLGGTGTTPSTAYGGVWGGNFVGQTTSGATNLFTVNGIEADVSAANPVPVRIGVSSVVSSTNGNVGTVTDCSVCVGSGNSTQADGWAVGLQIGDQNGYWPITSNGTLISAVDSAGTPSANDGINFANVSFTGYPINLGAPFSVNASGLVQSGEGYNGRDGSSGTLDGHIHNFYWDSVHNTLSAWVDATNLGNVAFTSDRRIKHNIEPMGDALSGLMRLTPVTFNWRDVGIFKDDHKRHLGLIAQDVQQQFPSAVDGDPTAVNADGTPKPETIDILPMLGVITKSIQELKVQIDREHECRRHILCRLFGIGA